MSKRIVPAAEFGKWLEREYRKQQARSKSTDTISRYRAYAVGNAWGMWTDQYSHLRDNDLTVEAYRAFRAEMSRRVASHVQAGTTQGYAIVVNMLDRVGVRF